MIGFEAVERGGLGAGQIHTKASRLLHWLGPPTAAHARCRFASRRGSHVDEVNYPAGCEKAEPLRGNFATEVAANRST